MHTFEPEKVNKPIVFNKKPLKKNQSHFSISSSFSETRVNPKSEQETMLDENDELSDSLSTLMESLTEGGFHVSELEELDCYFDCDYDGDGKEEQKHLYFRQSGKQMELVLNPPAKDPIPLEEVIQNDVGLRKNEKLKELLKGLEGQLFRKSKKKDVKKPNKITESVGNKIRNKLNEIAKQLVNTKFEVPKTSVKAETQQLIYNNLKEDISKFVEATPLTTRPPDDKTWTGFEPKSGGQIMKKLYTIGNYKRGHMLNSKLHGPGTDINLVPISNQANADMREGYEKQLKIDVNKENQVIHYKIVPHGKLSSTPEFKLTGNDKDIVGVLPAKFKITYEQYIYKGAGARDNIQNWQIAKNKKIDDIANTIDFNPLSKGWKDVEEKTFPAGLFLIYVYPKQTDSLDPNKEEKAAELIDGTSKLGIPKDAEHMRVNVLVPSPRNQAKTKAMKNFVYTSEKGFEFEQISKKRFIYRPEDKTGFDAVDKLFQNKKSDMKTKISQITNNLSAIKSYRDIVSQCQEKTKTLSDEIAALFTDKVMYLEKTCKSLEEMTSRLLPKTEKLINDFTKLAKDKFDDYTAIENFSQLNKEIVNDIGQIEIEYRRAEPKLVKDVDKVRNALKGKPVLDQKGWNLVVKITEEFKQVESLESLTNELNEILKNKSRIQKTSEEFGKLWKGLFDKVRKEFLEKNESTNTLETMTQDEMKQFIKSPENKKFQDTIVSKANLAITLFTMGNNVVLFKELRSCLRNNSNKIIVYLADKITSLYEEASDYDLKELFNIINISDKIENLEKFNNLVNDLNQKDNTESFLSFIRFLDEYLELKNKIKDEIEIQKKSEQLNKMRDVSAEEEPKNKKQKLDKEIQPDVEMKDVDFDKELEQAEIKVNENDDEEEVVPKGEE